MVVIMMKIEDKLFKDFTQFKVSRLGILDRGAAGVSAATAYWYRFAGLITPAGSHKSHENKRQLQELTKHLEKQVILLLS